MSNVLGFEPDFDHEFLAVQHEVVPADILAICASEIGVLHHGVDWPEFGFDYREPGEDSSIHPVIEIDLSEPECFGLFAEAAPMLHGVLSEVAIRPTALENSEILPTGLGKITLNLAWGDLRSGWHYDFTPADEGDDKAIDRIARVLYVTGQGRMEAVSQNWHIAEWGAAGSLMEMYNPAKAPLLHQGTTTDAHERLAIGFQQLARRVLPD